MTHLNATAALVAAALRLRAIEEREDTIGATIEALALLRFSNPDIQDWLSERLQVASTADRKARVRR